MSACDPWTESEMVMILESHTLTFRQAERNQCLFAMQCATGGRVGELLGLKRRDVLDTLGRPSRKISFTNTKNGLTRQVDLINPFVMRFLHKWLIRLEEYGHCKGTSPLFLGRGGVPMSRSWWYKLIRRSCEECRLPGHYGTHSARKTWAMNTYKHYHARAMKGELIDPLLKLQEAGGWKTIEAARRYISFMLGDTKESQIALYPALQAKYGQAST